MITILIDFFDKETERHISEIKMDMPDDIIISAAQQDDVDNEFSLAFSQKQHINYINARPFALTQQMKDYATKQHPELKEKFDQYLHEFIGRHGLGPEYD